MKTTVLSVDNIKQVLNTVGTDQLMHQLIDTLDRAFCEYNGDNTIIPTRQGFTYELPNPGLLEWMPIMSAGSTATIKLVSYHPRNPIVHEIPTILSSIYVYDVGSGHLSGVLDGTLPTAMRTGAASAIASRYLAQPGSHVIGIIGAGAQAVTQLHALSTVFNIERVLVYDVEPAVAKTFPSRTAFMGLDVEEVDANKRDYLLAEADILCTVTSASIGSGPVFEHGQHKPHLHINAVGSDFPGKVEVPKSLLDRAFVCPDFTEQAMKEGECQQLEAHQVGPALYEIVQDPGRWMKHRRGLTVFDSTGWALEDAVVSQLFLDYAKELNLGQQVELQHAPLDPLNPYDFEMKQ